MCRLQLPSFNSLSRDARGLALPSPQHLSFVVTSSKWAYLRGGKRRSVNAMSLQEVCKGLHTHENKLVWPSGMPDMTVRARKLLETAMRREIPACSFAGHFKVCFRVKNPEMLKHAMAVFKLIRARFRLIPLD